MRRELERKALETWKGSVENSWLSYVERIGGEVGGRGKVLERLSKAMRGHGSQRKKGRTK